MRREDKENVDNVQYSRVRIPHAKKKYPVRMKEINQSYTECKKA